MSRNLPRRRQYDLTLHLPPKHPLKLPPRPMRRSELLSSLLTPRNTTNFHDLNDHDLAGFTYSAIVINPALTQADCM